MLFYCDEAEENPFEIHVYGANIKVMIAWSNIAGFEWDSQNKRRPVEEHEVTQFEAEQVFFNEPLMVVPNPSHRQEGPRFHALGRTDAKRFLHITFTLRAADTLIRVISARDICR